MPSMAWPLLSLTAIRMGHLLISFVTELFPEILIIGLIVFIDLLKKASVCMTQKCLYTILIL